MLFRVFLLTACMTTFTFQNYVAGYLVHKDELKQTVRIIADTYITYTKKTDLNTLPVQLKQLYENYLSTAETQLMNIVWNQGNLLVDYNDVQRITEEEMNDFVERFVKNFVYAENIDSKINDAICDLIGKNDLSETEVKNQAEYQARMSNVKKKLDKIMSDNYSQFVYIYEIEKAVSDEFLALINRIIAQKKYATPNTNTNKKTRPEDNAGPSWQDFWNWLLGTQSNTQTSNKTNTQSSNKSNTATYGKKYSDSDIVYNQDIEQVSLDMSNQVIKEAGYEPENIPARVVSDYSDTVQKVIKKSKDQMGYYNYVYAHQIKDIAKTEIKSIVDKIKYKGEKCCICLDDIKSDQTLGVLSCGHFYHKDCINQSLKYKSQCPLCGTYTNKIDHTESVPK